MKGGPEFLGLRLWVTYCWCIHNSFTHTSKSTGIGKLISRVSYYCLSICATYHFCQHFLSTFTLSPHFEKWARSSRGYSRFPNILHQNKQIIGTLGISHEGLIVILGVGCFIGSPPTHKRTKKSAITTIRAIEWSEFVRLVTSQACRNINLISASVVISCRFLFVTNSMVTNTKSSIVKLFKVMY